MGLDRDWVFSVEKLTMGSTRINRNAFNLTSCHWVITSDGNTIESNSGLDLSSQESKKKAFKACATKGSVKSGRNQKTLKQANIDVQEFIKRVGI